MNLNSPNSYSKTVIFCHRRAFKKNLQYNHTFNWPTKRNDCKESRGNKAPTTSSPNHDSQLHAKAFHFFWVRSSPWEYILPWPQPIRIIIIIMILAHPYYKATQGTSILPIHKTLSNGITSTIWFRDMKNSIQRISLLVVLQADRQLDIQRGW